MTDDDSPFAHIPTPGIYERPSALTPAAEIAAYAAVAEASRGRPRSVRVAVGSILLVFLFAGALGGVGFLFFSDDSDPEPSTPTPPSSSIQTVPLVPNVPLPTPP